MLAPRVIERWEIVLVFWRLSGHGFLFSFTLLVALKLDHVLSDSWWVVFTPLWWLCHAVISGGRFSLPTPPMPHDKNWAPFHSVMATPLLVAFEILLFLHLEDKYAVDLKLIFLPLLAFEVAILVYNVSECFTLMPRDEETMSDDEPLLYTWVSIWMVSFVAAITFTLVKSRGDLAALDWWDLSINLGIAECFGFLVSTKLNNQSIHSSSSVRVMYREQNSNRECGLLDIGGYVMKIPFIIFQIILLMSLEGTPASPKNSPIVVLFVPLFLIQGARVLFVTYISVSMSVLWIYSVGGPYGRQFARSSARIFLRFFQHCKRLLGGWSINKGSQEEQVRLHSGEATGYNTFSPEVVKKMPKSDLVEEVCRLKAALSEQTDSIQQEKNLCKVCFEDPVNIVLFPCRHHVLCSTCCKKCETCPICRVLITHRVPVYDA
ncbi:hypothetical protein Bca4012_027428 [Brassica carinata]|uniref:RING-type domain-containing protein n=1 Tax=Brassica carinata TaxID=52824 RepID=A0A8X7VJK8_BRACI|nr:hypothetical protein Bca52824_024415 [Brassica carinata]